MPSASDDAKSSRMVPQYKTVLTPSLANLRSFKLKLNLGDFFSCLLAVRFATKTKIEMKH